MSFLGRGKIKGDGEQDWVADSLGEAASGLVDIAFDDWGPFLVVVGCVVAVVFVAVSLFCLLAGVSKG